MRPGWPSLFAAFASVAFCAVAQVSAAQTFRSDSPLWTHDDEPSELYPRAFMDGDEFGCQHTLRTGVWRYIPADDPDWPDFWRLGNYGVFHCALIFGIAANEAEAAVAFEDLAWMIRIGNAARAEGDRELWVLQIGVSGGSQYKFIQRTFGQNDIDVLEPICPRSAERRRAQVSIWVQDDCIIESRSEMASVALAAVEGRPSDVLSSYLPKPSRPFLRNRFQLR